MLDDIRTVLVQRAFLDVAYLSQNEIDALLERQYGKDWKEVFGVEGDVDKVKPITPYTGKSQRESDEEFFKKKDKK